MPTIPDFPQDLLDIHHHWHVPSEHPGAGPGRQHAMGTPGGGLEFLTFHRNYMGMFHSWYDTHAFAAAPFSDPAQKVALVEPWSSVPAALQADPEWPLWAADAGRLDSGTPDFATADALGTFIEVGIHNQFIHGAAATAFMEPLVQTFHSPLSTYFYGIHGLVDHWWSSWTRRHKHLIKELIKDVVEIDLKELRDMVFKRPEPEVIDKRFADVKMIAFDAFEDVTKWVVDPPAVDSVRVRLERVERQVFKNALTFIPAQDRPDVGMVEAAPDDGSGAS
jgi:hypothetical protein